MEVNKSKVEEWLKEADEISIIIASILLAAK